jgi:LuxR family transcriptional regulator, maltose regulon positive regulatory protein
MFDWLRADLALKMGNTALVENWLQEARLPPRPEDDPARENEFLVKTRYLIEKGALAEARQELQTQEGYARQTHHNRFYIAVCLLNAVLEWKNGDLGRVKLRLEEALSLAVPQCYLELLLDYGAPLLGVMAQLPDAPAEIRNRFPAECRAALSGMVEMLTAREMDVLKLLAEGQTNAEMAGYLVLSSETVKIHLKHIFQKLEVNNRRQAVRRGRELGLI